MELLLLEPQHDWALVELLLLLEPQHDWALVELLLLLGVQPRPLVSHAVAQSPKVTTYKRIQNVPVTAFLFAKKLVVQV